MGIKKISLKNFTVFEKLDLDFSTGVNIFIGENGMGKTHVMKVLYSACQAVKHDVSFPAKVVRVFRPDESSIRRMVSRKNKGDTAVVKVTSDSATIGMTFTTKSNKWDADVTGETLWEKQLGSLESTFIPAKEILSNAWNLTEAVAKGNVDFDDTYIDIIAAAKIDISQGRDSVARKRYLDILQAITTGKVTIEKEKFYLRPGTQARIEFNLVAEGIRKIALLWQLIKNGTLENGSILFWDEPEANINPIHVPMIVDMLLELQRNGVQIFISTHDYIFAKYFEVKRQENDNIKFYSLYKDEHTVRCETNAKFSDLKNNPIMRAFDKLLDEVYTQVTEG